MTRPGRAPRPAKARRLAELGAIAALAAILASTGTYAVTRVDNTPSPTAQTSTVMAVGNPLGLAGTVTTGIVSALNRPVTTSDAQSDPAGESTADPVVTNAIQTSAAINPRQQWRALVNSGGQLIGINSAIASLVVLRQLVLPERQHRDRLRDPGQRGALDRRTADHLRQGHPPLPRGLLRGRRRRRRARQACRSRADQCRRRDSCRCSRTAGRRLNHRG